MQFATNNMLLVVAALLVAAAPAAVRSLSDGAPVGACKDMVPQHHTAAQTSAAPYTVTATKRGAVYDVKIAGQSAANTIKGFMVQAKHNGKLVGEFVVPASDKHTQYVNCGGNGKNSVTQKRLASALKSLTLTWDPKDVKGTVIFHATIVQNINTFWVGIKSNPVKLV